MSFDEVTHAALAVLGEAAHVAEVDPGAGTFRLTRPVDAVVLSDLVADALGRPHLCPDWMPTSITLDRLELTRIPRGVDLILEASVAGAWRPFDGLTVTGAGIELRETSGKSAGAISGAATLDGHEADLELTARLEVPSQVFVVELVAPDPTQPPTSPIGTSLLHELGVVHASSTGTPRLVDLSLSGSIATGSYTVHVEAHDLLHLPALTIDTALADVVYGPASSIFVAAQGTLPFRGDVVTVDLAGEIDPTGWRLSGQAMLPDAANMGALVDAIAAHAGARGPALPDSIRDLTLTEVELSVDTADDAVTFHCTLDWAHEGAELDIALEHRPGGLRATGLLQLGGVGFAVTFERDDAGGGVMVGTFSAPKGEQIALGAMIAALGGTNIPHADSLHFTLGDVALAHGSPPGPPTSPPAPAEWLVAADLGLGLDLAAFRGLPLVGSLLPPGQRLELSFGVIGASDWSSEHLQSLAGSLPATIAVPASEGFGLSAQLELGDTVERLTFGLTHTDEQPVPTAAAPLATGTPGTTLAPTGSAPPMAWHPIGRSFGPVHVNRVGLAWDGDRREVDVALDASLGFGGLVLSLQGFGARYSLDDHDLALMLHGLGLDLRDGPVEIAGAFLNNDGDFSGKVLIRTEQFSVAALGAFAMIDGAPSVFVYGVLDYPIGGPAFFFVEGLAAGFAVNRQLLPPTVDGVRSFPLVVDAIGAAAGTAGSTDPGTQLAALHEFVRPALGDNFLAVGIKFSSFELIHSFLLLIVGFGSHPEIDVIGSSTYQSPPDPLPEGVPALVHVGLDLVGRFPLDGEVLQIEAKLTKGSYVYSPLCRISGGFAFYSWVAGPHAGEFVLAIGGYHPSFDPTKHEPRYPTVAPLELTYQITPQIELKGSAYLALTPSLVMAGASVVAAVHAGSLQAGFALRLDFLMGWKPYYYSIDASVAIYARWKCFSTHASATIAITGPEFAGHAHVDWFVFSFDVDFGVTHAHGPTPIAWSEFRDTFVPADDKVCSVRVLSGLISSAPAAPWVVNPATLVLSVATVVPATRAGLGSVHAVPGTLGIAPMNVRSGVTSDLTVTIERLEAGSRTSAAGHFDPKPIPRTFPAALWGEEFTPALGSKPTVDAIGGLTLRTKPPTVVQATDPKPRRELQQGPAPAPLHWPAPPAPVQFDPATGPPTPTYTHILEDLGFRAEDVAISPSFLDEIPTYGTVVVHDKGRVTVA
ncbi:MAG: DUF6603 domain-containing protein [Acidimicrobiia bacterium]